MMIRISLFSLAMALGASAMAHDFTKGDLFVDHPWARAAHSTVAPAAAYFDIVNRGEETDRLVSARAEIAEAVEIHQTTRDDKGVVSMKPVEGGVEVAPGEKISFETGAYHVMMIGLKRMLHEGDTFPLTLVFEKAGEVEVTVNIEERTAEGHDHH